jgi:hypothetical protein
MIMANYLDYLLSKQKWNLLINNEEHLLYVQTIDESSYIEVKKKHEEWIEVSVPVKNSQFQYKTTFKSEMPAYEYIENYVHETDDYNHKEDYIIYK